MILIVKKRGILETGFGVEIARIMYPPAIMMRPARNSTFIIVDSISNYATN